MTVSNQNRVRKVFIEYDVGCICYTESQVDIMTSEVSPGGKTGQGREIHRTILSTDETSKYFQNPAPLLVQWANTTITIYWPPLWQNKYTYFVVQILTLSSGLLVMHFRKSTENQD